MADQLTATWWSVRTTAATCYLRRPVAAEPATGEPAGAGGLLVVDPGLPGDEEGVLTAVRALGHQPGDVTDIVLTHWHSDHSGAAPALVQATGARVHAGTADADLLRTGATGEAPDLTDAERPMHAAIAGIDPLAGHAPRIQDVHGLEDGDRIPGHDDVVVVHVAGHTPGSVALHVAAESVVLTGDLVREEDGRVALGMFHHDRQAARAGIERLASLGPRVLGPGHGDRLSTDVEAGLRRILQA